MQNPVNGKNLPAWALQAMAEEGNTELRVLRSAAGFYIGTLTYGGSTPNFRASVEYWSTREKAEAALDSGQWTVKLRPQSLEVLNRSRKGVDRMMNDNAVQFVAMLAKTAPVHYAQLKADAVEGGEGVALTMADLGDDMDNFVASNCDMSTFDYWTKAQVAEINALGDLYQFKIENYFTNAELVQALLNSPTNQVGFPGGNSERGYVK